jgi:hypothetical protein
MFFGFLIYLAGNNWRGTNMLFIVLTNNPQVMAKYGQLDPILVTGDVRAVFKRARDLVHKGHRLLTHPLSSSLKPGRIPYKTVILTVNSEKTVDLDSVNYMAAAMDAWEKTRALKKLVLPPKIMDDYAQIDLSVFESALASLLPTTVG